MPVPVVEDDDEDAYKEEEFEEDIYDEDFEDNWYLKGIETILINCYVKIIIFLGFQNTISLLLASLNFYYEPCLF